MANKPKPPMSAVGKLMFFVDELEIVLHPRVIGGFKQAVWDARTEMAKEARDQKVSQELQQLEPVLNNFRQSLNIYRDSSPDYEFYLKPVIKKIIELYGKGRGGP